MPLFPTSHVGVRRRRSTSRAAPPRATVIVGDATRRWEARIVNTYRLERASAWSGLVFLLIFGLGWLVLARFFPPISPDAAAAGVAAIYRARRLSLMLASVLMMSSIVFLMPVSALFVLLIQKIERRVGILTLMMGFTLTTNLVVTFYTALSFSLAAFRAQRSPELVQFANDLGFLQFMGGISMFVMAWFVSAYAILVESPRENPVLPRWVGYVSLWMGLLYLPELLIYFFRTGPFAWDGIVGFWIPAALFVVYFLFSPVVLVPAVRRHFR
ncbi:MULTISPECIES: hypothetical protein [Burkholderia]|uniref:Membrane protein n=1 Tax=Burkholderia pseudomallei (strain K96243) TaxID=272560 RepID=Q63MI5_BURPS|nr:MULTISPECIES: hypothetical protein [Burkholderia]MCV9914129.1 hypothetical protein [Burkholderia pseudomallei]MCV9971932.1 hypothetical protein [Burkholderia pseudomallei]MCW0071448.1 hypothetical protein [Burkholderia pseudomallei]MDE3326311.1 hypothetical protein [Burkholderia pseudomallei]OMS29266.1 hypothetical protein AQ739_12650 [Burkholderia pseudomallei]